jgi:molybdopterin/thiamine biosynthesis adenylyltransferase
MQDPHDNGLTSFYRDAIARARAYLNGIYLVEDFRESDKDFLHVLNQNKSFYIWRITVTGELRTFTFYVAIPQTFPDSFPKLYLSEADYAEISPIPHIDKNRFVCTRDPATTVLNDGQPGEAIEKLLKVAVDILEAGIKGEMKKDFEEEYLAYWNDESELKAIVFSDLPTPPARLLMYALAEPLLDASYLIVTSNSGAISWLQRLGVERHISSKEEILFLQLQKVPESLPKTNRDILVLFAHLDPLSAAALDSFRGNTVLACISKGDDFMLFAWAHLFLPLKGFRRKKGKIPLKLSMKQFPNEKVFRIKIKRLDRNRLIRRAVDMGIVAEGRHLIAIVGCGSVGSNLAMLLAKSGSKNFILIDEEALLEDNVARHLCGIHDIATTKSKVEAVKNTLEKHLPFIKCDIHQNNILDLLSQEPQIFGSCKIVIFATANMAAERRANHFFHTKIIKPVIYSWLEPYGVAGHVLFVSPEHGGCYRCCFDPNGDFLFSVSAREQSFDRREAGCQTTFLPYGAADLGMFCSIACKIIIGILSKMPERSTLFTWIGDRNQFESNGFKISDDYAACDNYSVHIRYPVPQMMCEVCKTKH